MLIKFSPSLATLGQFKEKCLLLTETKIKNKLSIIKF